MGVARQAPALAAAGLVGELKAEREDKGAHAFDKRVAMAQELNRGGFMVKIDGDGPIFAGLVSGVAQGSPSGQMVGVIDDTRWG